MNHYICGQCGEAVPENANHVCKGTPFVDLAKLQGENTALRKVLEAAEEANQQACRAITDDRRAEWVSIPLPHWTRMRATIKAARKEIDQ